jgi:hypothetical protein
MALILLARLRVRRLVEYDALLRYARNAVVGGDVLFLPSLNFLYLMGLVDYHPKTDAFEYVGPNEAL